LIPWLLGKGAGSRRAGNCKRAKGGFYMFRGLQESCGERGSGKEGAGWGVRVNGPDGAREPPTAFANEKSGLYGRVDAKGGSLVGQGRQSPGPKRLKVR